MSVKRLAWFAVALVALVVCLLVVRSMRHPAADGGGLSSLGTPAPGDTTAGKAHVARIPMKNPAEHAMSPSLLLKAQAELKALRYYEGPIDGEWSQPLYRAIRRYQSDKKLPVNGVLDRKTRALLNI